MGFPDLQPFRGSAAEAAARGNAQQPWRQSRVEARAPYTQPLEPILFPKLRIYFADFPYLHCSMDQRLHTLET